jgi:hypothetical protein
MRLDGIVGESVRAADFASYAWGMKANPFRCFKTSPEVIRLAVMV